MKLLLRRNQRSTAIMGNPVFMLEVRAEISPEERALIVKYKLGKEFLYVKKPLPVGLDIATLAGIGSALLHHALNITVSVNDLANGKQIECKNIMEMLAAEEQIKEAAKNFGMVLRAAAQFGGEEVVPF
jgi:hypothetical protein